jgi:hypothetical protein
MNGSKRFIKIFLVEHEWEALLLLLTMLGISRYWILDVRGLENIYSVSQWALSYDYGLIRRGLLGTIVKLWNPILTMDTVRNIAEVVYYLFLALLLLASYAILKSKDIGGRVWRLILLFVVNPATLSLLARDLGRFDIFLIMVLFFSMILLSVNKYIWLIPIFILTAMFIHESFIILYLPTLIAAMMIVYSRENKKKKILLTLIASAMVAVSAFIILIQFGNPRLSYNDFFRMIQSRSDFTLTDLSIRECFYSINDHVHLASSSLYDAGSIANLFLALLFLSPIIIILFALWATAFRSGNIHPVLCKILSFATLSGLLLIPVATDYGRWISAITFCNIFSIFFLLSMGIIKVEELTEFSKDSFSILFMFMFLTYLLFGPFHDWNPYPYKDNILWSSIFMFSALSFDIAFFLRWRSFTRGRKDFHIRISLP